MEDFDAWITSYSNLTVVERERSRELIGAYKAAIFETQAKAGAADPDVQRLFTFREIEQLVLNYRAKNYTKIGPAMLHYLGLLEQGYVAHF